MKQALIRKSAFAITIGLLALLSLNACSGKGSASASASGSGGGGSGSGSGSGSASASGTITGFGSLYINGKKFETNGVEVQHDGVMETCTINQDEKCGLQKGMTVKVRGTFSGSSYTADAIVQEDTLEGPIAGKTTVDASNGTLTILGQTVLVDDTTTFDDISAPNKLDGLNVGDVVEVGGFVKSDGVIAATFVERKAVGGECALECEVKGTVKDHDRVAETFQIGNLTVNYGSVGLAKMQVSSGSNWDGIFVEVKGTVWDSGTNTLTATEVELESDGLGDEADTFHLERFVTSLAGMPTGFVLGSTAVQVTTSTIFLGGTNDEVTIGQKLEVEGPLSSGVMTATKVKFEEVVKLEGNVSAKPTATMNLDGLTGISISANSATKFSGVATLTDLNAGNHVEVRGRQGSGNSVIATEVKRIDVNPKDDLIVQGVVQSAAANLTTMTILGVPLSTIMVEKFLNVHEQSIGIQTFFGSITPNETAVKAKGKLLGSALWKEMELESE